MDPSASGMGLGVAEHLVRSGWNVATSIFDFDGASAAQVVQKLGEGAISIQGNATVYSDQAKVFTEAWEKWKRIDLGIRFLLDRAFVDGERTD